MQVGSRRRSSVRPRVASGLATLLIPCLLIPCLPLCAMAGPNAGGALLVVTDDAVSYTSDVQSYAQLSAVECPEDLEPGCPPYQGGDCLERRALAQGKVSSRKTDDLVVFWVLASFPEASCSRVRGLNFGIDYDPAQTSVIKMAMEGDAWVTSNGGNGRWPSPGSGVSLTWNATRSSHLFEVAWFVLEVGEVPTTFRIVDHPLTGRPTFADDSVPTLLDPVGAPDDLPPVLPVLGLAGADGTQGGIWIGDDPVVVACCLRDGTCRALTALGCSAVGGAAHGVECDPISCVTATAPSTWGRLKQRYR